MHSEGFDQGVWKIGQKWLDYDDCHFAKKTCVQKDSIRRSENRLKMVQFLEFPFCEKKKCVIRDSIRGSENGPEMLGIRELQFFGKKCACSEIRSGGLKMGWKWFDSWGCHFGKKICVIGISISGSENRPEMDKYDHMGLKLLEWDHIGHKWLEWAHMGWNEII